MIQNCEIDVRFHEAHVKGGGGGGGACIMQESQFYLNRACIYSMWEIKNCEYLKGYGYSQHPSNCYNKNIYYNY